MFDTINGLPVHPLVVHAVVVLLPCAIVGAFAIVLRPAWRERFGVLVVLVAGLATLTIPIATSSGEALQRRVGNPGEHTELGDQLIWFALPLFVLLAAYVWINRVAHSNDDPGDSRRTVLVLRLGSGRGATVRAGLTQVAAAAAGGEASFACRLMDGADAVAAEISVGPKSEGRAQLVREGRGALGSAGGVALVPGRTHLLEFAFVDRRVSFALDGKEVIPPADLEPAANRGEVRRPLQLGARGCRLVVRGLKLSRDIHYTQYGEHGTRHPAALGPREYYVLGDNSGNSQDSRKWPTPGVPEDDFIGKPFLVHQPLRLARVGVGGRDRAFQTLDWSRLRWLH
jgi:uncharacterized membrane protein